MQSSLLVWTMHEFINLLWAAGLSCLAVAIVLRVGQWLWEEAGK